MRKLNLVFLAVLLASIPALGVATYFVHDYQMKRNAKSLLDMADEAEAKGKPEKAAESLSRYLELEKRDGKTYERYARVLDELYKDEPRRLGQVLEVYQEALRFNPKDPKLLRRCAELAMTPGLSRTNDAKTHWTALLLQCLKDPADPQVAEIHEKLAECFARESNFDDAVKEYKIATSIDETRIASYVNRAELGRQERRLEPTEADGLVETMVKVNPKSGLAWLHKYRYDEKFRTPDASDLQKAMELAGEDAEVLLTAALKAQKDKNFEEARKLVEKGLKAHPDNWRFSLLMADLEVQNHPDRAEAILRKAFEVKPQMMIAYRLASLLISKPEGEAQAEPYIAVLRSRGLKDSFVRALQAQSNVKHRLWNEAIREIEEAQEYLKTQPQLSVLLSGSLTRMLAECYRQTGRDEQRLAVLQSVAAGTGSGSTDAAQLEVANELTKSGGRGGMEHALRILQSLAEKRPELELDIARLEFGLMLRKSQAERNWPSLERQIKKAEEVLAPKKIPAVDEALIVLRARVKEAQGQPEAALDDLRAAATTHPDNPNYVVALFEATLRQGDKNGEALRTLDEAEKKPGRSPVIRLARLVYWGTKGGPKAKAEVAKLADLIKQAPEAEKRLCLEQLAITEMRLGEPALGRQHMSELVALQPNNLSRLETLFDWTLEASRAAAELKQADEARKLTEEVKALIDRMVKLENPELEGGKSVAERDLKGTYWRFAKAAYLISQWQNDHSSDPNARPAKSAELEQAKRYAEEIKNARPQWWGGYLLQAQIAELNRDPAAEIILAFQQAIELGYTGPTAVQRLVLLLMEQNRYDDVDQLIERLGNQTRSSLDLRVYAMLTALRKKDYKKAIPLAQELYAKSPRWIDHWNLGRYLLLAGRVPDAGEELRKAVELGRGAPSAWVSYVSYLVANGKLEEARNQVEEAKRVLSPNGAALPLAECLLAVGEAVQAESLVVKALKEKPDDPATLRFASMFYLTQGRSPEAMKWLDALSAPAPGATSEDLAWAGRTRARVLLRTGRSEDVKEAFDLVQRNLKDRPNRVPDLQLRASILASQPKPERKAGLDPIEELEKLDGARDLEADDQFLLALLYLNEKQDVAKYEDEMLKVLVDQKSNNPRHLANYVDFLISHKKLDEAERWLDSLTGADKQGVMSLAAKAKLMKARNPGTPPPPELRDLLVGRLKKSPELLGPVASLLASSGFPADAEAAYREFVARDPKKPERVLTLANFLAGQKGRTAEATDLLARAWQTCPPEQVAMAALSLYEAPSVTEAQQKQVEAWVAEASRKRPDLLGLSSKLAAIWIRQGRFDEAEGLYRRVLESNRYNPEALNNLAWLLALRYPGKPGKTDEALEMINLAIEVRGPTASLIDTKAVVLICADKPRDAQDALNKAKQIDQMNCNVPLHLALALKHEGKTEAAKAAFQEAIKLGWKLERSDPLERTLIDPLRRELGL